jgi:hypothetical protein
MSFESEVVDVARSQVAKKAERPFFLTSIVMSITVVASALSFPQFFLFVPFASGMTLLSTLGFLTLFGWVILAALPPLVLYSRDPSLAKRAGITLFVAAAIYPLATLSVKITGLALYGQLWAEYLLTYPILFVVEWIFPMIYAYIALRIIRASRVS